MGQTLGEPNIMVLGQEVVIDRGMKADCVACFVVGDCVHHVCHKIQSHQMVDYLFNRPGVSGAVLQTPSSFIDSLIKSLSHSFPPHLQDIINPKPLELGR